jgi:hypothetical protein
MSASPTLASGGGSTASKRPASTLSTFYGPVLSMKAILVRDFAMGGMALSLVENEGFKYILGMLVGTNKLEKTKGRAITPGHYFAIYHDDWKSAMDVELLALRLTAMLFGVSPWVIYQWKLTCRKFPHPHSIIQLMICPSPIPRIRSA